jgi:phospholipid/cholesterol/gamma-HCH transport system permease protein
MAAVLSHIDQQVCRLGRVVTGNIAYTIRILQMVYVSMRATLFDQTQGLRTVFSVVSTQIYFTGWQAMPLITILALASGGLVILQSASNLNFLGGGGMIGNLLVVIVVRELAPLLTALVVIARSGTAVASEVGNMRANREIEALESMGINPLSYIVFPRILGGIVSVLCLSIYFVLIALVGGFVITKLVHDMSFGFYFDSLSRAFSVEDVWLFLLKNSFSGMIIFVIACYQGLSVRQSPTEVPIVTTQAVVKSIIYVISFNMTATTLFYIHELTRLGVL